MQDLAELCARQVYKVWLMFAGKFKEAHLKAIAGALGVLSVATTFFLLRKSLGPFTIFVVLMSGIAYGFGVQLLGRKSDVEYFRQRRDLSNLGAQLKKIQLRLR